MVEEQAGLRRVATVVAGGASEEEVFAAVTEEVGQVLAIEIASIGRYESDGTATFPAVWTNAGFFVPPANRWPLEGKNLPTLVAQTGRPARMDSFVDASGAIGASGRERGYRSQVGTPIVVEGRVWGLMIATSTAEEPLPSDTEARLASYTELLSTAIANAESRAGLGELAAEQAALRRVATLVAQGVHPQELFTAVVEEVGQLLPVDYTHMGRYEPDGAFTFVAVWSRANPLVRVGSRLRLGGKNPGTMVFETGRPARIDGFADASGPIGVLGRESGVRSAIGTPITVEGRLWGSMSAGSIDQPLPSDTDTRLAQFTELVGMAIANAENRAELTASRARIVAAADESRRRIERDLHDGAQQRLVHAVIVLKLALRALANGDPGADELVAEGLRHTEQANSELRELAHGILPGALRRGGLRAGVDALASRVSLPVSADVSVERLPASVEATAYFVISEALTNVVKHSRAHGATVIARTGPGQLRVEVSDDGVGGASRGANTGLRGLEDRVSALNGRLVLDSPPGGGTRVCALLPIPDPR
jgi:signal transduction histidine kinase